MLLSLFGGALALLLLYTLFLRWGWRRARRQRDEPSTDSLPAISVVVAARNEADTLPTLLDALDAQTHPDHEVVIVDDASTDETAAIAEEWASDRVHARVVQVTDPVRPRKKHALTRGIEAATHDLLAFTDADCRPPPDWLQVLAARHAGTEEDCVLVGYSPLQGSGLLGTFARYETLVAGLYTVAALGWNRPYMAVGRNLSYPRSVFEAVGGFASIEESMSGDDDLFVQAVHRQTDTPIRALLDDRTFVPSDAPSSWRDWWWQRRRHVSAGRHYDGVVGLHLTLLHASLVLLWIAPLVLGKTGIGLLATGLLVRHSSLGPAATTFDEADLLAVFPLWELGYALYYVLVVPLGLLRPPNQW
jgi:cellulose synthase/poly-beta-1,6-N-acetylglucosamine synthase-like glycosyltransferase